MTVYIFRKCQMKHIWKHTFEIHLFANGATDWHVRYEERADGEKKRSAEAKSTPGPQILLRFTLSN